MLKGVRMRMQRTVRVLYMIHCTFRDGFQVQHHLSAYEHGITEVSICILGWIHE